MHRREKRIVVVSLVCLFVVTLAPMLTGCGTESSPWQEPSRATPTKPAADTPKALRAACIETTQREAGSAYAPVVDDNRARLENPAQRFGGVVDSRGIVLAPYESGFHLGMRMVMFSCEGSSIAVGEGTPRVNGARVEVSRKRLTEWYMNGPLGVEHGVVLQEEPGCAGSKRVVWEIEGDVSARLEDPDGDGRGEKLWFVDVHGREVAAYSEVFVTDALGKPLPAWLSVRDGRHVELIVDDAGATYPAVMYWLIEVSQEKLIASDGASNDSFGYSVALSGDTAIVGARGDDTARGSAYVFVRNGTTWSQQAKLVASDGITNDSFGCSVALSGDTVVVGALGDQVGGNVAQGSTYVFARNGTTWTEQTKLVASDGAADDQFGKSVSLSGDTVIVGAYVGNVGPNTNQGAAYVYTLDGTIWTEQTKLIASDGAGGDYFGYSVALVGDTAIVGAINDGGGRGAAYIFVHDGTTWSEQTKLDASDGIGSDLFGYSVALSGETAIVAAHATQGGTGSVYVFVRNGTTWTEQAKLVASDGAALDYFGASVALSGETALVGAYLHNVGANGDQGSAYVFVRNGTSWTEQTKLVASDGAVYNYFGISVSLSGDTALAGAYGANTSQGSAYIFVLRKTNGDSCMAATECVSDFCVDGVCCNNSCTDLCKACSAAKKGSGADGTCDVITPETDPDDDCLAMPGSSCETTGSCDGAGACELFAAGYECARTCTDTHALQVSTCDGLGNCMPEAFSECPTAPCQHTICDPQNAVCTMVPMSDRTPCSFPDDQGICIAGDCFIDPFNPSTSSSGTGGMGGAAGTGGMIGTGGASGATSSNSSGNAETVSSSGMTDVPSSGEISFRGGGCSCNTSTSTNHSGFTWLVALALGLRRTKSKTRGSVPIEAILSPRVDVQPSS